MRFWDSSAVVPLCVDEKETHTLRGLVREDGAIAVWWGTLVECQSAFARARRQGGLSVGQEESSRASLRALSFLWTEISPAEEIRSLCGRLLLTHPLRAADSLQLAAAIAWAGGQPEGDGFVSLDQRLREAARIEGFRVLPAG